MNKEKPAMPLAGPHFALLTSEGASDGDRNEAARVYRLCRRWGGRVVVHCPRAAASSAGGRISRLSFARGKTASPGGGPQRLNRNRLYRRPKCCDRLPIGRRAIRSAAGVGGRAGSPSGGRHHHTGQ